VRGEHCTDITPIPEGKTYRLSGEWDVLGVRLNGARGPDRTTRAYRKRSSLKLRNYIETAWAVSSVANGT